MKKILLIATSLIALAAAAPAVAADLAARPYTKAPVMMPAAYDWSGFYIGANGGWGSSRKCWDLTNNGGAVIAPSSAEGCHDATGGLVGGQVGYRWQASNWVFGLEAQGDWANLKGSNASSLAAFAPVVNQTKIDAIGLFTGQVGYAWNNVLGYVKGGAAWANQDHNFIGTIPTTFLSESANNVDRFGWTVGGGLEWMFAPGWSVFGEYNYMDFGTKNVSFAPGTSTDIDQQIHALKFGVNYKFGGGPIMARY